MPDSDIRLLALDGGGVRGLSSLMILRSLMAAVDPDNPPKPCDYFDMIGGTSTGGLIAVMLGRLRISVDDCIKAYVDISDQVFQKKSHRVRINGQLQGRFDSRALERAIKQIIKDTGHDENVLLKDPSGTCKVFVCATSKETGDNVCLTSYRSPRSSHLLDCTTIWEACRATSAATTFFDPVTIGPFNEQFVDGALGLNNPVSALWNEAQDVWGARLRGSLRCLVSIGTGVPALRPVRDEALGIVSTLKQLATETEKTAEQFRRDKADLDSEGRYFRFNVTHGLEDIGLEESRKKADMAAATRRYVQSQDVLKQMTALANGPTERQCLDPYRIPFSLAGVPVSAKFVDRPADTAHLEKCLLPYRSQRDSKKVFVLHGLGGVGKTQLAADFARRHQAAFSAIFWLDGRSEDRLRRSIAACVRRIPDGQIPSATLEQAGGHSLEGLAAAVDAVIAWLGRPDHRDWLLVFDNVDLDHEQGVEGAYDVMQYLPWDHGAALVTTRVSRLAQLAPPGHSCNLAKVDSGLGRAILEAWYDGDLGPSADDLLSLLDGLPLALAQAASYLRETGVSIARYLQIYRHQWNELMAPGSGRPLLDYDQGSMATTWTVSFGRVEAKDESAAGLLRLWAFLDNKRMCHRLLRVAARDGSNERLWPGWLRDLASSELRFLEAVRLLLRYSMIEAQEQAEDSYSMHPVVHKWATHLDTSSRRDEHARLALMLVGWSVPASTEREYWGLQLQLLPHAQRCAEWMRSGSVGVDETDEAVLSSFKALGGLYADQSNLAEAEAMYTRALAAYKKALGPDHTSTLRTAVNLGVLYVYQGRLAEAEATYGQAIASVEKALGPDHPDTLTAANTLGLLYTHQGRLAEAEAMYRRALTGREKALGPDHTITLTTISGLGILYANQGRLAEAEAMYRRALAGREKTLGPDHIETLITVNNIGNVCADQGRLAEAEAMHRRALAGREKILGPNHRDTLFTIQHLGYLYANQGRLTEAEAMYRRVIAGYERVLGPDHTDTLLAMTNLGSVYANQGDRAKAEAMYQQALAGYENALEPDHTSMRLVLRNLESLQKSAEGSQGGKLWKRAKMKFRAVVHSDRFSASRGQVGGNEDG